MWIRPIRFTAPGVSPGGMSQSGLSSRSGSEPNIGRYFEGLIIVDLRRFGAPRAGVVVVCEIQKRDNPLGANPAHYDGETSSRRSDPEHGHIRLGFSTSYNAPFFSGCVPCVICALSDGCLRSLAVSNGV